MGVKPKHIRMRIFIVQLLETRELSAFTIAELWADENIHSSTISSITSQLRISKLFEAEHEQIHNRNSPTLWTLSENYQEILKRLLAQK